MSDITVRVSYMELTEVPPPVPARDGRERIRSEKLVVEEYLKLYQNVGKPLRWDQRLKMPRGDLERLLQSDRSQIFVLRDAEDRALGFCEFERNGSSGVELKNFGLISSAHGNGLGTWLLLTALHHVWELNPRRVWLHTDEWDHPAALHVYGRAGFRVYAVRHEPPADL